MRQPVTIAATVRDNMLNILQLPTRVPVVLNITDAHSMKLTAGGTPTTQPFSLNWSSGRHGCYGHSRSI